MKKSAKYDYTQISVPKQVKEEAEEAMTLIGCRTMTSFATMALKEYIAKLKEKTRE